jgi:hypothetical protein
MRAWILSAMAVATMVPIGFARADQVSVSGSITQSTSDGTGPAVNNPGLNGVALGDSFALTLDFVGSISAAGTYNLTGGTLLLSDPAAPASEDSFEAISLTVSANGASDDISLFGCLTTGDGCLVGNSLSLNFAIPSAGLNLTNAWATIIPGLYPPLDLLEDDGITDIQGNVTSYSYTGNSKPVPEPASFSLLGCGLFGLVLMPTLRVMRRRSASSV